MAQNDTVRLETVIVKGFAPEKFMSGLKIQKIDSTTLSQFRFQNIGELLSYHTPIAFKNYGPGQLSTASFRGTSANHTAVLWNGLNINSPTLGQTDFSTIPVAGFDQLSVQYGSAASIVGTDAVGGSILLNSVSQPNGIFAFAAGQLDSFLNNYGQTGARYGTGLTKNWDFSGKTTINYSSMVNQFQRRARKGYSFLSSETFQQALVQDLFFTSKDNQEISAHIWLTKNKMTVVPGDSQNRELTSTEAYRTMVRYQIKNLAFRTSWVRDVIDYAKGDYANLDHAFTDKFSNRAEKDFTLNFGLSEGNVQVKAGAEMTHYRTHVSGYEKSLITETRGDLFMLTRLQANVRWLVSANLRQALITKYNPPFTPSLGTEYQLIQNLRYRLKIRGSYARSYRVPTLNERYWKDLGNPDIRPESGWNKEIGFEQRYTSGTNSVFTSSVSAYHNRVKDWTYWNPSRNYHVENLQEVLARGIEVQAGWHGNEGLWNWGADLGYAYNRSSQEKVYDAYSADVIGKQLVFVPIHTTNFNAFLQYKSSRLSSQVQSGSKRFSTFDNSQFLNGYTLTNILIENTVTWDKTKMRIQGQVNNIGNTFYLSVRNYAMPGRSFAVNVIVSYNAPSKGPKYLL
ncbi:TonB-dependent receptor plug domain-containing protein [Dyadobacter bucti]|uniref:TonB-dependent receptor plug domain-containing protein n=1 Tax=Dyadobacter bucti TaxID=2572203 RepID=UPI003F6EEB15